MPRGPLHTPEEIRAVIEALHGQGLRPTLSLVRARLGGSSHGTIHPVLKAWREERERQLPGPLPPLPGEGQAAVTRAAALLWEAAVRHAEGRVLATEQRLGSGLELAREEARQLMEALTETERERDLLAARLAELEQALAQARDAGEAARGDALRLGARAQALQAELAEVKAARDRAQAAERQALADAAELRGRLAGRAESRAGPAGARKPGGGSKAKG